MQFIKKHRRVWIAAALFCLGLVIFYAFWQLQVADARQKGKGSLLNDMQDGMPVAATQVTLRQILHTSQPLYGIGLLPRFEETVTGELQLTVYAADGTELARVTGNLAETLDSQWAVFVLPGVLAQPDGWYLLEVTAALHQPEVAYAFATSAAAPDGWLLTSGDTPQPGALCVMAVVDQVGGFLTGFYWVFSLLCCLVAPGLYLAATAVRKIPLHRLFAVTLLFLGLLYCFILPPYSAPDERFHINRAFNMSSQLLGVKPAELGSFENVKRAGDYDPIIMDELTTVFTYRQMAQGFFTLTPDSTPQVYTDTDAVGDTPVPYWPSALGVTLGRLLGLGFVPTLFLGRLCNLLCVVALLAGAVKLAPFGKAVFMVVGLLPITLHLAASYSRDALAVGLYLFFTAWVLWLRLDKKRVDGRDMLLLAGYIYLAAPIKIAYMPVLLLVLLLPKQSFYFRGKALAARWVWLWRGACLLLAFATLLPLIIGGVSAGVATVLASGDGAAAQAQATGSGELTPANYNIGYILQHPRKTLWLLVNSLFANGMFYWQTMLGGVLGYFNLPISWFFVLVFTLLLVFAALPHQGQTRLGKAEYRWGALFALAAAGLVVIACVLWTPTDYTSIYGIQGRYFLPILPLAALCLQSRMALLQKPTPCNKETLACAATASTFALLNAFLVILAR